MTHCLHGKEICPSGQVVYYRQDAVVRCGETEIPIKAAHNTPDGIAVAVAPESCPMRKGVSPKAVSARVDNTNYCWRKEPRSKKRKFSDEQIIDIRERAAGGEKQFKIAKQYGVSSQVINQICSRLTYKDVG